MEPNDNRFWYWFFTFFADWKRKFNRTKFSGGYYHRQLSYHGDRYRKARDAWVLARIYHPDEVPEGMRIPRYPETPTREQPYKRRFHATPRR